MAKGATFIGSDSDAAVNDARRAFVAYSKGGKDGNDLSFQRKMCILLRHDLEKLDHIYRSLGQANSNNGVLQPTAANLMNVSAIVDPLKSVTRLIAVFCEREDLVMLEFGKKWRRLMDGLVRMKELIPLLSADVTGRIYHAIGELIWIASGFEGLDDFQREFAMHRSYAEFLCQIWLADDMNRDQLRPMTSQAINNILAVHEARGPMLSALLSQAPDPMDIVGRLTSLLRASLDRRPFIPDGISLYCSLIMYISCDPSLLPIFRRANSTQLVIEALKVLTKHIRPESNLPLMTAMAGALECILSDFESQETIGRAAQIIRSGFFPLFVKAVKYFSSPYVDASWYGRLQGPNGLILNSFPENLTFYSFIVALADSMDSLEASDLATLANSPWPSFDQGWFKFKSLLLERMIYRRIYDRIWKPKLAHLGTCDNVRCLRTDETRGLKKCSGCKVALYCSKECQKAAWKGHKFDCASMSAVKDPASESSKHDIKFMQMLSEMNAAKFYPGLKAMGARRYPGLSFSELAITVDLTMLPAAFDVHPLNDSLTDPDGNARNVYESARRAGGNVTLIKTLFFASRTRGAADVVLDTRDRHNGPKSARYATMPALDAFQVGVMKVNGKTEHMGSHGLPRFMSLDKQGMPVEGTRDIVDEIADCLDFADPLDWMKGPRAKPGDRLQALHKKIDAVIDRQMHALVGPIS